MKTISANMDSHIDLTLTTLSTFWKIERKDGTVLGFTDHDVDKDYDGVTYDANSGFSRSSIRANSDLTIDNLDVESILNSSTITEADLRAGRYDGADVFIFLLNWDAIADGPVKLKRGTLGQVILKDNFFTAELEGLAGRLKRELLDTYTPECTVDLGSTECGFAIDTLKQSGQVVSVTDRQTFTVATSIGSGSGIDFALAGLPPYGLQLGKVRFTSGSNNNLYEEIKAVVAGSGEITLFLKMPFTIAPGDTLDIWPGCDKRFLTCKNTYGRNDDFRGFPLVPGRDNYLNYPDARA